MAHFICEQCGGGFKRGRAGARPIRFCAQKCYHEWRAASGIVTGQFVSGHEAWNKGMNGLHLSPATEFKKGHTGTRRSKVGDVNVRVCKRDGKHRAWVKIAEPNVWKLRSVVEWEKAFGPVPTGCIVHHMDRDTLNDSITNLSALSRAAHLKEHRHEFEESRISGLSRKRRNGVNNNG